MNLQLIRGDDFNIDVELVNDETGEPINISGCTLFFTVKRIGDDSIEDTGAVIEKDITNHIDPEGGKTTIPLSHDDTNIGIGDYNYDIQIKDSNGKLQSTEKARMTIIQDISRRTS